MGCPFIEISFLYRLISSFSYWLSTVVSACFCCEMCHFACFACGPVTRYPILSFCLTHFKKLWLLLESKLAYYWKRYVILLSLLSNFFGFSSVTCAYFRSFKRPLSQIYYPIFSLLLSHAWSNSSTWLYWPI